MILKPPKVKSLTVSIVSPSSLDSIYTGLVSASSPPVYVFWLKPLIHLFKVIINVFVPIAILLIVLDLLL